jgi:hypothetical protein
MTDEPLSGAQFARQVGTDPEKWAQRFLAVYAEAEGVRADADRLAFVASWFRDAMEAAVKAADPQYLSDVFQKALAKDMVDFIRKRLSELDLERSALAASVSGKPSK